MSVSCVLWLIVRCATLMALATTLRAVQLIREMLVGHASHALRIANRAIANMIVSVNPSARGAGTANSQ